MLINLTVLEWNYSIAISHFTGTWPKIYRESRQLKIFNFVNLSFLVKSLLILTVEKLQKSFLCELGFAKTLVFYLFVSNTKLHLIFCDKNKLNGTTSRWATLPNQLKCSLFFLIYIVWCRNNSNWVNIEQWTMTMNNDNEQLYWTIILNNDNDNLLASINSKFF